MQWLNLVNLDKYLCQKCKHKEGSFYHLWWGCKKMKKYWSEIHTEVQKILQYDILKCPEIHLLGLKLEEFVKEDRVILWYMTVAAR